MAKFCSQCGRPLKEGEVCDCKKEGAASGAEQRQPEQEDAFRQSQWDNSYRREKQSSEGIISFLNTTSRSLGNALDKIYNFMTLPTVRDESVIWYLCASCLDFRKRTGLPR